MANSSFDENNSKTLLAETNDANRTPTPLRVDPTTKRLLIDLPTTAGVEWGDITGTLSDQTDLQTALDDKLDLGGGTLTGDLVVPDEAYGVGWNGSLEVPTKNAVYDKIESLSFLLNIVEDTSPQLGGNLDLNSFTVGDADAADLTKLSELTATSTELNYVDGVTSAIQTQLDAMVEKAGDTMTGDLTIETDLQVDGTQGLGNNSAIDANKILNIDHIIVSTTDDYGFFAQLRLNPAGNIGGFHFGGFIGAQVLSGNTRDFSGGIRGAAYLAEHNGLGTVAQLFGATFEANNRSTGTVTSAMGINVVAPANSGGGTLTAFDGIFIDRPTAAATNHALRTAGGNVVFNDFLNGDDFTVRTDNVFQFLFIDGSADTLYIGSGGGDFLLINSTNFTVNELGADSDFRVESDGNANALFVDGGNNRVGILNGAPAVALDVTGEIRASTAGTDSTSVVTVGGTQTLTGKTLTAPRFADGGFIADANGNEMLIFDTVASAVNELTLSNAAASGDVILAATGGDTNITLVIASKGTDPIELSTDGGGSPELYIKNSGDISLANNGANIQVDDTDPWRTVSIFGGMAPATTSPCAAKATVEAGTNDIDYQVLAFDASSDERAFVNFQMPASWDGGAIQFRFVWTNAGGASTETVQFELKGRSYADDEAIDQAGGTAVAVTDTWLAQNDIHISAWSGDVTLGGTPAASEWVHFEIMRDVSDDTLTGDCRLIDVQIRYKQAQYSD